MNPKIFTFAFVILNINNMENQNYPAWKHAITYGIYLGIALIIMSLLFYVFDLYTANWTSYITYAVLLGGIVVSAIYYRDKHLGGYITFKQSFLVGFYTALFAGLIAAVYTAIFMSFAGEEFKAVLLQKAEESMIEKNPEMTDEQIEMAMKWTGKMMNPVWLTIISFLSNLFFGAIFSLLGSIFIKKENKSIEVEQQ
jgi:hypothetical protein